MFEAILMRFCNLLCFPKDVRGKSTVVIYLNVKKSSINWTHISALTVCRCETMLWITPQLKCHIFFCFALFVFSYHRFFQESLITSLLVKQREMHPPVIKHLDCKNICNVITLDTQCTCPGLVVIGLGWCQCHTHGHDVGLALPYVNVFIPVL